MRNRAICIRAARCGPRTAYRPAVEYAYAVNGREHRGNQINYGMNVSAGRGYAEKVAAQYPVGG